MNWRSGAAMLVAAAALALAGCQTTGHGGLNARQVATLRSQGFEPTSRGWEFSRADRLLFAVDKSEVLPEQRQVIQSIGFRLKAVGIVKAAVEGHADDTGSADYNLALSKERAEAVARVLVEGGFPESGLTVVGLGEKYPVDTNRSATGRKENRRVVILIPAA